MTNKICPVCGKILEEDHNCQGPKTLSSWHTFVGNKCVGNHSPCSFK